MRRVKGRITPPRTSFRFTTGKSITIRSPKEETTYFPKRTLRLVIDPPITITQLVLSASGSDLQAIPPLPLNRFLKPAQKLISTTRHAQVLAPPKRSISGNFVPSHNINLIPSTSEADSTPKETHGEIPRKRDTNTRAKKDAKSESFSVNTHATSTKAKRHV